MKLMPFVVFDGDELAPGTPSPAEPAAVAPAAPAPVAPAPVQPPAGDGPWAADLASLFPDETIRGQVDQFLRSKVQPHVTSVEQQFAPAKQLWQDLQAEDPAESIGTYVAVAEQLYGPEVARAVAAQFEQAAAQTQPTTPQTPEQPPAAQLSPEQQSAIEFAQAQQAEQLYQSELNRVSATAPKDVNGNSIVHEHLFAPFVVGSEGDFDQALASYQQWYANAYPSAPAADQPPAPATLDTTAAPAVPAPTTPAKQTLAAALEETMAEMRASRAPATVGQV